MKNAILFTAKLSFSILSISNTNLALAERLVSKQNSTEEGIGYIVGGAAGIGLSLTFANRSNDLLQGFGYSALAGFSMVGLLQGIDLLTLGSQRDQQNESFVALDAVLSDAGISSSQRKAVHRKLPRRLESFRKENVIDQKFWTGLSSLGASAAGIFVLSVGKSKSPGVLFGLGMFSLTMGIFGISQFVKEEEKPKNAIVSSTSLRNFNLDIVQQGKYSTIKTTVHF